MMTQEVTLDCQRAEYRLFGETFMDSAYPREKDFLEFKKPYSKDLFRKIFRYHESQEYLLVTVMINDSYEEIFACRVGFIEYRDNTIYAAILVTNRDPAD